MGRQSDCSDSDPPLGAARATSKRHECEFPDCGAVFSRPGRLRAHALLHRGKRQFKCAEDGCTKAYSTNSHLKRHVSTAHERRSYVPVFTCPEAGCHRQLSSEATLKCHHRQVHNKPFKCDSCGAGFNKHAKLAEHAVRHSGDYPYKCDKCGVRFASSYLLKQHARGHKTYACGHPGCRQSFERWTQLRKHCKLEHPRQYECADCQKVFTSKNNLRLHVAVHLHPLDRGVLLCPHDSCPRFYFHKRNLMHHVRSSHEGRRVPCDEPGCERTFCTKQKMEDHKKLHDPKARLPRRRCKARRKRKDAGQPKRSVAAKLSGARVPYRVERQLLDRTGSLEHQLGMETEDTLKSGGGCESGRLTGAADAGDGNAPRTDPRGGRDGAAGSGNRSGSERCSPTSVDGACVRAPATEGHGGEDVWSRCARVLARSVACLDVSGQRPDLEGRSSLRTADTRKYLRELLASQRSPCSEEQGTMAVERDVPSAGDSGAAPRLNGEGRVPSLKGPEAGSDVETSRAEESAVVVDSCSARTPRVDVGPAAGTREDPGTSNEPERAGEDDRGASVSRTVVPAGPCESHCQCDSEGRPCHRKRSGTPHHEGALPLPRLLSMVSIRQWLAAMLLAMRLTVPDVAEPV
ncbi:zinc finger protein ZXDC-like [Bacillus rossius redtenbacheri]|uniref:zinc finger protein ZXDC-like n=1 Tax=Bacillus rossius redtenbacheri TaxID=93214 RepID=UPI002FDDF563